MASQQAHSFSVFLHQAVVEMPLDIDDLVQRLVDAASRNLHLTRGSHLKTLRGPFGGRAFRLRLGNRRVPFSWVPGATNDVLVVHHVGERHQVYESAAFASRLRAFHENLWSFSRNCFSGRPDEAGYFDHGIVGTDDTSTNEEEDAIQPWLSDAQAAVLHALLPFPETWRAQDSVLVIAKGAPGSGKTVIGAELASVATAACEYDALVLVPTQRLRSTYLELLGTAPARTDGGRISVALVQEFFQDRAGNVIEEAERESKLRNWWNDGLRLPALNGWAKRYPSVHSTRFLRLLDALLEGDLDQVISSRDALDLADAERYARLKDIRNKKVWLKQLRDLQGKHGLTLRCQAAAAGTEAPHESGPNPLLIIVDECQDLVPAEWQALLTMVHRRRASGEATRLALLGDENQRIAPTSFSWGDVNRYAVDHLGYSDRMAVTVNLPGSFRLRRKLAATAAAVFSPKVTDLGSARHLDLPAVDSLQDGGAVTVILGTAQDSAVEAIVGRIHRLDQAARRFILLYQEDEGASSLGKLDSISQALTIRSAKGLEFQGALVVPTFPDGIPVQFDRATALYTALTRVTDRLVCLIDPIAWRSLASTFQPVVDEVLDLSEPEGRQSAFERLLNLLDTTSVEEQADALLARIDSLIEEARLTIDDAQREAMLLEIVVAAERMVGLGRVGKVVEYVPARLAEIPDFAAMLSRLAADTTSGPSAVTASLILGDLTGTLRGVESGGLGPLTSMAEQVRTALERSSSPLQQRLHSNRDISGQTLREAVAHVVEVETDKALQAQSGLIPRVEPSDEMTVFPTSLHDAMILRELRALEEVATATILGFQSDSLADAAHVQLMAVGARLAGLEDKVGLYGFSDGADE